MANGSSKAKWTVMVYMAGFNNLSSFADMDIAEMKWIGSSDELKIAVFVKQLNRRSAVRAILSRGEEAEVREEVGDADSGKPQTMLDFIRWAHQKAPADKYALVVWNHGSGWEPNDLDALYDQVRGTRGDTGVTPRELGVRSTQEIARTLFSSSVEEVLSLSDAQERAIASDDGTGHSLDTIELGRVLDKATEEIGRPLDVLGMDACLMSALEVAYQAQDFTTVVVGSEELEPGNGWPYDRVLEDLSKNLDMDGPDFGRTVVNRYVESYADKQGQWPVTQCAMSAANITPFAKTLDSLAGALTESVAGELASAKIIRAHGRAVRFAGELIDLNTFCAGLVSSEVSPAVTEGAQAVMAALKPGEFVLAEGHLGPKVEGCAGITAYLPSPTESFSKYYADLDFSKDHLWDDFIAAYHRAIKGG